MITPSELRPFSAHALRDWIQLRILDKRAIAIGLCTTKQAKAIAWRMSVFTGERTTGRADRLAILGWLVGRTLSTSKELSKAEAGVLIDWLSSAPPEMIKQEIRGVLIEVLLAEGHRALL